MSDDHDPHEHRAHVGMYAGGRNDDGPGGDPARAAAYEIGYGKPPVATRFKKGRSGNPNGRPKGSKSAKALLEAALAAPVKLTEGGEIKIIEQRAALFRALVARAIKGDNRSAALVLALMEKFGMSEQHDGDMKLFITIGGEDPLSSRR